MCSIAGKDNNKSFERKTDVNNQISEQREQRFNNRRVRDDRDNRDSRVNRDQRDNRDNRDNRENRENRENQPLNTSDGSAGNRKCPEKKNRKNVMKSEFLHTIGIIIQYFIPLAYRRCTKLQQSSTIWRQT